MAMLLLFFFQLDFIFFLLQFVVSNLMHLYRTLVSDRLPTNDEDYSQQLREDCCFSSKLYELFLKADVKSVSVPCKVLANWQTHMLRSMRSVPPGASGVCLGIVS